MVRSPRTRGMILRAVTPTTGRMLTYPKRDDGTRRGPGFFGEISEADSPELYATECPVTTIDYNGVMKTIPMIVPTCSYEEICHLVGGGRPTPSMIENAKEYAANRRLLGVSPFAALGEQRPLPERGHYDDDEADD